MIEQVAVDSDYEYEFDAKRKATTTGAYQPAASLASVTGYFTMTRGGAALGSTTVTMSERSSTPGRYFGICDAAVMTAALGSVVGLSGFKVYKVAGDRVCHEPVQFVSTSEPL